jgi:hypothetical protein
VDIGAERIHHSNVVAASEEFTHNMLADETGTSGDENSHACACSSHFAVAED